MGRTVIAEEGIEYYIKALIELEKFKAGLIFGQEVNAQKAYVIHLSRTPDPAQEETTEQDSKTKKQKTQSAKNLESYDDTLVIEHARQVMRSLSGGISILGLFVISPDDVFQNAASVAKLRKLAASIDQAVKHPSITVREPASSERIILHISSTSQKCTCKSVDILNSSSSPKPADWKYQTAAGSPWMELHCNLNVNFSVGFPMEQATMTTHVQKALGLYNDAVKKSLCLFEGVLRNEDEVLDSVEKEKAGKRRQKQVADEERQKSVTVELLVPEVLQEEDKQRCLEDISFKGQMCIKAYVHGKATVGEAIEAVREDIIRSLWARCDMHCDSLIGEEQRGESDNRPVLHEPPRRVLAPLPFSPIPASDYLFPGEGPTDSLLSLAELLDLGTLMEGDIQDYWEAVAEVSEILDTTETPVVKTEPQIPDSTNSNSLLILIAAVAGLMAVLIAYIYI